MNRKQAVFIAAVVGALFCLRVWFAGVLDAAITFVATAILVAVCYATVIAYDWLGEP